MTLARATVSGVVYRSPEKRFTSNNIPVTSFTLNIGEKEETLLRIIARGNLSELTANSLNKGDKIVAEGRLQLNTVKTETGAERKVMEIDLSSFEKLSGSSSTSQENESIVDFAADDFNDELLGEEEIPF